MGLKQPTTYGRSPYKRPPGSLADTLRESFDGVDRNFELIQASIQSLVVYSKGIEAIVPPDVSEKVYVLQQDVAALEMDVQALEAEVAALEAASSSVVLLTAAGGGSTWALSALTGYPNIRAVVIDPNGEANTLNLPALGASDKLCITVKCLANSGSVNIVSPAGNIVTDVSVASNYGIPYAFVADGTTFTTYAATLIWDGSNWHVIDNAIRIA